MKIKFDSWWCGYGSSATIGLIFDAFHDNGAGWLFVFLISIAMMLFEGIEKKVKHG